PPGSLLERGEQGGGRRDAEATREELRRLLPSQPQQRSPVTPPDEPPEEVGHRRVGIPLGLPEGADDEYGDGLEVLGDKVEQQERGSICRMDVVQDQHQRAAGSGSADEGGRSIEQTEACLS